VPFYPPPLIVAPQNGGMPPDFQRRKPGNAPR
jgi:hypothetical protein